jgi:hypothetical protein
MDHRGFSVKSDIWDFNEICREDLNLVKFGQEYRALYMTT